MPEQEKIIGLKREYNSLLKEYYLIEDYTVAIVKTPSFKRINRELKRVATEIASVSGFQGDVHDFFSNSELITGFVEVELLQEAAA